MLCQSKKAQKHNRSPIPPFKSSISASPFLYPIPKLIPYYSPLAFTSSINLPILSSPPFALLSNSAMLSLTQFPSWPAVGRTNPCSAPATKSSKINTLCSARGSSNRPSVLPLLICASHRLIIVVTKVRSLGPFSGPRGRRCAWMKFVWTGREATNVVVDDEEEEAVE